MLEQAGFGRIERLAFRGPNDSSVMIGVKQ